MNDPKRAILKSEMAATTPEPTAMDLASPALPPEFTLHLGAAASDHVMKIAQSLAQLGAEIQIQSDGTLIAFRPLR